MPETNTQLAPQAKTIHSNSKNLLFVSIYVGDKSRWFMKVGCKMGLGVQCAVFTYFVTIKHFNLGLRMSISELY
jgi:hypothetical protein